MREKWTDERLDDLKEQVVTGFDRLHVDLAEVRREVAADLVEIRREMAANQRLLVQLMVGTIGTVVLSFLGLLLSHA